MNSLIMKRPLLILMLGLFALTTASNAQIRLWNNGGIAIGDTTDPGSEKTVFHDDVEFTGDVTGIDFPDPPPTNNFDYKVYFDSDIEVENELYVTNGSYHTRMAAELLQFSRNSSNYIQCGTTGGTLSLITNGRSTSTAQALIYLGSTATYLRYGSGTPANRLVTTSEGVTVGDSQIGDILTVSTSNSTNSEGGLLIAAASAGSSYFRYNRMGSWAGKTLIGNNASTTSDSPTTAIEIDGTSGSNVINMLGDLNMSATKDISLPDNSELHFGDATKGMRIYSDGSYLRLNKGSSSSALPFYITSDVPQTYIYSPGIYLGYTSGATVYFRGNTLSGDNWGINSDGTLDVDEIGIGTTSPDEKLEVVGNIQMQSSNYLKGRTTGGTAVRLAGVSNTNDIYLGAVDNAGGKVIIREDGSDRIAIVGGNVGIGDTTPSYKLDVNGTGRFTGSLTASSLTLSSGMSVTGTASFNSSIMAYHDLTVYGTFTNMSDRALKTDIAAINVSSLDKLTSLQGVTYRFINDEQRTMRTGFIAQDVQKIFPELVSESDEGLGIKTLELIPHLVEAIKEQKVIIDKQQETIANLDARLKALEER